MLTNLKNKIIVKLIKKTAINTTVIYELFKKMPIEELEIYLEIYKKTLDK
jgi:hypothetical protein